MGDRPLVRVKLSFLGLSAEYMWYKYLEGQAVKADLIYYFIQEELEKSKTNLYKRT